MVLGIKLTTASPPFSCAPDHGSGGSGPFATVLTPSDKPQVGASGGMHHVFLREKLHVLAGVGRPISTVVKNGI